MEGACSVFVHQSYTYLFGGPAGVKTCAIGSVALVASMDGEPVRRRLCLKSKQWKHKPVTEQQVVQTTWILRAIESYAVRL